MHYFNEHEDIFNEAIEQLDNCNGYLGDDRFYSMDMLPELIDTSDIFELLNQVYYGNDLDDWHTDECGKKRYNNSFNPNRDYFRINGYGNLESTNYIDYTDHLDSFAIKEISKNRWDIDAIDDDPELAELFDEYETETE